MKSLIATALISVAAAAAVTACSTAEPIDINQTSLEKTSPFETPTPQAYDMGAGLYRETQLGAPAMIPHDISSMKITAGSNPCMMCHGNTEKIGAAKVKGQPTSMHATHRKKIDGKLVMQATRHECTLCHAPQANVEPLVPTVQ